MSIHMNIFGGIMDMKLGHTGYTAPMTTIRTESGARASVNIFMSHDESAFLAAAERAGVEVEELVVEASKYSAARVITLFKTEIGPMQVTVFGPDKE